MLSNHNEAVGNANVLSRCSSENHEVTARVIKLHALNEKNLQCSFSNVPISFAGNTFSVELIDFASRTLPTAC